MRSDLLLLLRTAPVAAIICSADEIPLTVPLGIFTRRSKGSKPSNSKRRGTHGFRYRDVFLPSLAPQRLSGIPFPSRRLDRTFTFLRHTATFAGKTSDASKCTEDFYGIYTDSSVCHFR